MKRGPGKKKFLLIPLFVIAFLALAGTIVMLLWNNVLTVVLHVQAINFWQAAGILVLCRILFGGFKGPGGPGRWRGRMFEKWEEMSPEERERFRERWKNCRRGPGWMQDRNTVETPGESKRDMS